MVRLMFFGGLYEVGKNIAALECGNDIIVIDCGLGFPELEQPGVDVVLPDITYLRAHRDHIRGIFITHGHEDHIGGLPYLLPDLRAPIHASPLTAALIAVKLDERHLAGSSEVIPFDPDDDEPIHAGVFAVTPFRVAHSIPDACGFGVETAVGRIVFTGDFKFDPTPVDGRPTDYRRLRAFGDDGVRLLVSDCVHVEHPGTTMSERVIGETFDRVILDAPGRVIVATFASLISRVQQLIDVASKHDRRIAIIGRSLQRNVEITRQLGYLSDPNRVLITANDAAALPDDRVIYVVTGSQGEPMAVLARISRGESRDITVHEGDTVVISASPIPGNETAVFRIIDQLFERGASVLYPQRALVHVSGHASRDELRRMIDLTRPQHIIPSHGEARHLSLYEDIAVEAGIPRDDVTRVRIGDVVEITGDAVRVNGTVPSGNVYLDEGQAEAVSEQVLRDRRYLGDTGVVVVTVAVDPETGTIIGGPDVTSRGVVDERETRSLTEDVRIRVAEQLGEGDIHAAGNSGYLEKRIRDIVLRSLGKVAKRRPVVIARVVEVDSSW